MAWIPLNIQDVLNSLTEAEQSGMGSSSAQSDLLIIVTSVTNLIRGKVNAPKRNQGRLGPDGTIPDELYAAAISIARFKYLTHLPGTQLITVDRRADKDEAFQQLEAVIKGELVIVRGDETEAAPVGVDSDAWGPNLQGWLDPVNSINSPQAGWPFWDGYW
jgi:hypothetical protein